jgi:hypothetical protein
VVKRDAEDLYLIRGKDLAEWLQNNPVTDEAADLTEAGIRRWSIAQVPEQATLRQAMDTLRNRTAEAVCVYGRDAGGQRVLQGIVTRESIEQFTLSRL